MRTTKEQFIQMNQTVHELVHTLAQTEVRHEREMRRQRWLLLGVVTLFAVMFYVSNDSGSSAYAQVPASSDVTTVQTDPQARAKMREALSEQLSGKQQQRLKAFEQKVIWINQYLKTWDEGMEGAVVALMLSNMAESMEAVPKMHEQMEVMNALMNAMPVVATEMQRMNANMSVITANMGVMTHNMDSTMGRMGRSMPWMPWQ
jgi:hypothetical protein